MNEFICLKSTSFCSNAFDFFHILLSNEIPSYFSREKLYQDEAKWSGYGEINCTDPKLLLEAIVVKLESMMPFIKVEYFDTLPEVTTEKDMKNQWTTYDGTDGRCYSFTPTMKMIKRGIAKIEMTFNMPVKIYIHTPGKYATARKGTKIKNVMGRESKVQVSHELFYTLDDAGKPCIQDSTYNKDLCMFAAFEKTVEKYGCTTPFGMSGNIKDKICKGKENDNATEVFKIHKTWFDEKDVHFSKSCPNPCHIILTAAYRAPEVSEKIDNGTSQIKLLFNNRIKIINDYQLYSGLSLLAEIGGYFGLFLGVSINQITKFISIVHNWIMSYYT